MEVGGEEEEVVLGPAAAYSAAVAEWLNQAYHAQMIQVGFSSFLAQQAATSLSGSNGSAASAALSSTAATASAAATASSSPAAANRNTTPQQPAPPPQVTPPADSLPVVYTIPPIWKRVVAEIIDFLILFTLKIMITFTAVDFFQVLDLENYNELDLFNLANTEGIDMENIDYDTALQFTSEILVLELIHRLVVCVFEALCTHRGPPGMQGGATPGKVIMGLKIVKCDQVIGLGGSRVGVSTGGNLGLGWALLRSLLKNLSLAFFFPVCCSLMFLPFSRTLYDILARSIVVESNYNRVNRVQG